MSPSEDMLRNERTLRFDERTPNLGAKLDIARVFMQNGGCGYVILGRIKSMIHLLGRTYLI